MVHCHKCGAKADDDDVFCPECGARILKEEPKKPKKEPKPPKQKKKEPEPKQKEAPKKKVGGVYSLEGLEEESVRRPEPEPKHLPAQPKAHPTPQPKPGAVQKSSSSGTIITLVIIIAVAVFLFRSCGSSEPDIPYEPEPRPIPEPEPTPPKPPEPVKPVIDKAKECSGVSVSINDACYSCGLLSCSLIVEIENTGSKPIYRFKVRHYYSPKDYYDGGSWEPLDVGAIDKVSPFTGDDPKLLEYTPVILVGEEDVVCDSKKASLGNAYGDGFNECGWRNY